MYGEYGGQCLNVVFEKAECLAHFSYVYSKKKIMHPPTSDKAAT